MDHPDVMRFKELIEARLEMLDNEDETGAEARGTVVLDQQSVGRLSRMDALQQQAMAEATYARRREERRQLRAALSRIAAGEFGICQDCGEEIAQKRLEFSPAIALCITCASGSA